MAAIMRWARVAAACGALAWWALACDQAAMAANTLAASGTVMNGWGVIHHKDSCYCTPNAMRWGYYETQWREWPYEMRPDKTFPASVNKEVVPPPPGQEPIPVPRGTLIHPGAGEGPGIPDFGPGTGGVKIDGRLPGGGLGGLEEPSEQPKTPSPLPKIEGTLPGLPGLTPTPKAGGTEPPIFEPPAAPKAGDGGFNRRPRGVPPFDPMHRGLSPQSEEAKVRADWTRVLEPGYRGETDRPRLTEASPARPQPNFEAVRTEPQRKVEPLRVEPIRQADHRAFDVPGRSAVQRPVFEQPAGQPDRAAPASWQGQGPAAMLEGYCPVDLGKNERWSKGDPRFVETYQGMTFQFSSAMQRECFLADPERYVPAYSGSDAVLLIEGNRTVPGKVDFCVTYDGRLYMFSCAESLAKFRQEPKRYTLTGR